MIDVPAIVQTCSVYDRPAVIEHVIAVESGGNPLAINVNGSMALARQPVDAQEGARWLAWLVGHGYSVDAGLMQVNSANWSRLGLTAETALDPCASVRAGSTLLRRNLAATSAAGAGAAAEPEAVSMYNTGSPTAGFTNGYVAKVLDNKAAEEPPPLRPRDPPHRGQPQNGHEPPPSQTPASPETATTAVSGFRGL